MVRNPKDVRQLAEEALQHMVGPELMRAALTADYTSECLQFLRTGFDIDNPDPATVVQSVESFHAHMQALFVHGYILSSRAAGSAAEKTGKSNGL